MRKEGRNIVARCVESGLRSDFAQHLTDSLGTGSHLLSVKKKKEAQLRICFFPLPHAHRRSAYSDPFWVKDFIPLEFRKKNLLSKKIHSIGYPLI